MVSASSAAACQLTANHIRATEAAARKQPKPSASPGAMRPAGRGRFLVRLITASMSRSYHMLMAPEAPAPTAMQSTATAASRGWRWPGATIIPAKPEKTTSDITRGFRSCRKSETRAPSPAADCDRTRSVKTGASLHHGQNLVGVERRRRGLRPLQGRGALAPGIGRDLLAGKEGVEHD